MLTAYSKIQLTKALVDSDLAEDPWFHGTLSQYFPAQIRERFGDELETHPLRKEIISTVVANQIVNYGGIAFAYRVVDDSGADLADMARAFVAAMEIFELRDYAHQHAHLGADVPLELWNRMSLRMRRLLDRVVRWFLHRQVADSDIQELVNTYRPVVRMRFGTEQLMSTESQERTRAEAELAERQGVPRDLAVEWAELLDAYALLDVARLAESQGLTGPEGEVGVGPDGAASSSLEALAATNEDGVSVQMVARVYFALFDRYGLENLLNRISALPQSTRWENMARIAMREDLYSTLVALAAQALESPGQDAQQKVQAWERENADRLERLREVLDEIESMSDTDDFGSELAALSVALRTLRGALTD